jgi:hypothetical protein
MTHAFVKETLTERLRQWPQAEVAGIACHRFQQVGAIELAADKIQRVWRKPASSLVTIPRHAV